MQITTRSKLSSVSWNSYVKSQLITSDYSGLIQLWDASSGGEVAQFDEHARRVWSVDFSTPDPMRFLRCARAAQRRVWVHVCTGAYLRLQSCMQAMRSPRGRGWGRAGLGRGRHSVAVAWPAGGKAVGGCAPR